MVGCKVEPQPVVRHNEIHVRVFSHILRNMEHETDCTLQLAYTNHLPKYFQLLEVGIVQHFRVLIPTLCTYAVCYYGKVDAYF